MEARPEFNWGGLNPEEFKSSITDPEEVGSSERPEFNWGAVDQNTGSDSVLPEGARNTIGGIHSGIVNNSFTANIGTYLEARMPLGRLFSENKDGEIEFWQSTPEWLGLSEDDWNAMPLEQRRIAISQKSDKEVAEHWRADPDSTGWMLGQIGGMLVDPTTAIPVLGATKNIRTATGAAIGATDMAAFQLAHEGTPTMGKVALGAVLGGAASRFLGGKTSSQVADEHIDLFNKIFPHNRSQTDDIVLAYNRTLEDMGINQSLMSRIVKESDKSKMMTLVTRKKAGQMVQDELEGLTAKKGSVLPKGFDKVFQPISDRFKAINPKFWLKLEDQQRRTMELAHKTMQTVDPFLRSVEKLRWSNKAAFRELNEAMFYGSDDIDNIVMKHLGDTGIANLRTYRDAMDNMYNLNKSVNPKIGYRKNYFSRWVNDYEKIRKHLKRPDIDRVETIIKSEAKRLKRTPKSPEDKSFGLTKDEINDIYNKYIQGFYDSSSVYAAPAGTKVRSVKDIPYELIEEAYASPAAAAHSYIKQMSTDIYRKKMFGKDITAKHGDNLTDSIGAIAAKYARTQDDADELKHLLDLLYVQGTRAPWKTVQWLKDIGYTTLLGNPLAAITQVGDIFLSAGKIGAMNTMHGLAQAITGKGLSPKEFGLMDNVIEELVSTGLSKKILDKALSWGQFKRIDQLGKATLMNGALRKFHTDAKTAKGLEGLRKKWAVGFGDEWPAVEKALRAGEINPNIKTMVFAELADIQPITLLEMPEMYVANPNGRLAYMLRTFSVKFLNLLRRDAFDKFMQGDRKQGIINGTILLGALNLGGITADSLKDLVLGREQDIEGTVVDNIIKSTILFNRYTLNKMGTSATPLSDFIGSLAPPVGWMDPMTRAAIQVATTGEVTRETQADVLQHFPVIGKLFTNYFMGGLEEYNRRL